METLKFRNISSKSIEEFRLCEYGSWEDYGGDPDKDESNPSRPEGWSGEINHVAEILDRWYTIIEVRNEQELMEVWTALCSGTFDYHYHQRAVTIANKLLPHVEKHVPEALETWPFPNGY